MNKLFRKIVYKLFKKIVFQELQKEMHKKFEQEQKEIDDEYENFDWNEFYDECNKEDYTEELREQGITL